MSRFEIFKVENGAITWFQSASTIKTAQAQIAACNHDEYIVCGNTRYQKKRIFLVGYDTAQLKAMAELLSRLGHEVFAATGNEAAMTALRSVEGTDLFVVGHQAPEQTRREMVTWLRVHFPKAKIVSLNPGQHAIWNADFNILWGKHDWILLVAAAVA